MNYTNYIGGIVKILELPKEKTVNNKISYVKIRGQFPQARNPRIVNLVFWGKLATSVTNYYKTNDYILVEGFVSVRRKKTSKLILQTEKKVEITVLRIYPFLLSSNHLLKKI